MPDFGAACVSRSGRTSAAVGNPLVPAGAATDLGQPGRETDGERLEIFGQLHGCQQQGVILQVARGRAGQIGLVERLADPAADPRPHPAVTAHPTPLPVPPPPPRSRDGGGSAPCPTPWGETGARGVCSVPVPRPRGSGRLRRPSDSCPCVCWGKPGRCDAATLRE